MLREAIGAVLANLDDETWLVSTLGALGARHAAWGVTLVEVGHSLPGAGSGTSSSRT